MINDEIALWGLTDRSSIKEVWDVTFKYLTRQMGHVSIATVKDGIPQNRVISIQRLCDGNIYFMTSKGKPFYKQVKRVPYIAASSGLDDSHHSIRIQAEVEECTDPVIYQDYADKNKGTMKMYRYNTDLISLFLLKKGFMEIMHLYRDDMVRRIRVPFGGGVAEPLSYTITDDCTGCGKCYDSCAEKAIVLKENGKYFLNQLDCDDCGICYTQCPLQGKAMIRENW